MKILQSVCSVPLLVCFWTLSSASCLIDNGEALLSYLLNNRMTILLKGTYASDRPLEWNEINDNRIFVDVADDSLSVTHQKDGCVPFQSNNCIPAYDQLPIYIDVGGIRLSSKNYNITSISDEEDAEKFWNIASDDRQVYCNHFYHPNQQLDSCHVDGGMEKFQELMNGKGVIYPSSDIPNGNYIHVGIFFRRVVTGWAYIGNSLLNNTVFDGTNVRGANIMNDTGIDPPEAGSEPDSLPAQWFPLHYRVGAGQRLDKGADYHSIVLEIRFNIKENLMVHGSTSISGIQTRTVAFSDWRRNHQDNDPTVSNRMGGNVLARSRFFYPYRVSLLTINNSHTGTINPKLHYFTLYQSGETDRKNYLPYAATPARAGIDNTLNHIMPGSYILECYRDDNPVDGYPETQVGSSMNVTVPETPGRITVRLACGS